MRLFSSLGILLGVNIIGDFPDLKSLPKVDQLGLEQRAKSFQGKILKGETKRSAIVAAISMLDLTTLEGTDTNSKIRQLCQKAKKPNLLVPELPSVAAICVYPTMVALAADCLAESQVAVASVAGAFPSGQASLRSKVAEIKSCVKNGADEIDIVLSRGAFLQGEYRQVYQEIIACKEACGEAHLKVILEVGELATYDNIRLASELAMAAGADFIKTSTGKTQPASSLPATLVMLRAIDDFYKRTGRKVGMKPAGGISSSKLALQYLVMVKEVLGREWLNRDLFRFGASSLVDDLLMQYSKVKLDEY